MKSSRKIAIIAAHASSVAEFNGADCATQRSHVFQVAKGLAERGHRIDIFTRREDPNAEAVIEIAENIQLIHIQAGPAAPVAEEDLLPYMDEFSQGIVEYCRASPTPYDVAHADFFLAGLAALTLREACGTPFVINFHELGKIRRLYRFGADPFPAERVSIEEMLVSEADRIIAESAQTRIDLLGHYWANPDRIDTVPLGFGSLKAMSWACSPIDVSSFWDEAESDVAAKLEAVYTRAIRRSKSPETQSALSAFLLGHLKQNSAQGARS